MTARFPLYAKILLWFFLNLALLGIALALLFNMQFGLGLSSLLMGQATERVQAVSEVLAGELDRTPVQEWDPILRRLNDAYDASFFVFHCNGPQLAGERQVLPPEVAARVERCAPRGRLAMMRGVGGPMMRRPGGPMAPGPAGPLLPGPEGPRLPRPDGPIVEGMSGRLAGPDGRMRGPGPGLRKMLESGTNPIPPLAGPRALGPFLVRTTEPTRYWLAASLPLTKPPDSRPVALVAMTPSLQGSRLGFDLRPWGVASAVAFVLSALLWLPLVRNLTRAITEMSRTTGEIARGRLDARVPTRRRDELGDLAVSINQMAAQLGGLLQGQKRFLGDTAHELCSPIARLQLALALHEQNLGAGNQDDLANVSKEVKHIADLVNGLLSFSQAELGAIRTRLQPVSCRVVTEQAVQREAVGSARIELRIPEELRVLAEPELLQRALANLLRNAIRYAGEAGPITVTVEREASMVRLAVADAGPGVPEAELPRIFEPFYRIDAARTAHSGGVGLGLAIVKTCVESCGGSVMARNRTPAGLEVILTLQ